MSICRPKYNQQKHIKEEASAHTCNVFSAAAKAITTKHQNVGASYFSQEKVGNEQFKHLTSSIKG